jgi:c-di-GMP-related signal transduction protein
MHCVDIPAAAPTDINRTEEVFLGRQPIVDRDGRMFAFELLFRSKRANFARPSDDLAATSQVLRHTFAELGVDKALGPYRGFVNCDTRMLLMPGTLDVLPPDRVVIEILESVVPTPEVVERLHALKAAGFALALDDYRGPCMSDPFLDMVDYVKIDLPRIAPRDLEALVARVRPLRAQIVAEKVQARSEADHCRSIGFDFFQGYFFARPVIIEGRKLTLPQLALLRLLNLLLTDADTRVLVDELKHQPGLALNLLRIANSAAASLKAPVHSIAQAVVLIGRQPLRQWVQLLLYTDSSVGGSVGTPLLQLAATRGRLMEKIAEARWSDDADRAEQAFMVGILSLMPAVFGVGFDEILPALRLPQEVERALRSRDGPLGELLAEVEALESERPHTRRIPRGVDSDTLSRLLVDAMGWANRID